MRVAEKLRIAQGLVSVTINDPHAWGPLSSGGVVVGRQLNVDVVDAQRSEWPDKSFCWSSATTDTNDGIVRLHPQVGNSGDRI